MEHTPSTTPATGPITTRCNNCAYPSQALTPATFDGSGFSLYPPSQPLFLGGVPPAGLLSLFNLLQSSTFLTFSNLSLAGVGLPPISLFVSELREYGVGRASRACPELLTKGRCPSSTPAARSHREDTGVHPHANQVNRHRSFRHRQINPAGYPAAP